MSEFIQSNVQSTISEESIIMGNIIGNMINEDLNDGTLSYDNPIVLGWIPCVVAEGNVEFLKAMAKNMYPDTRGEIIVEFLDKIVELRTKGIEILHKEE